MKHSKKTVVVALLSLAAAAACISSILSKLGLTVSQYSVSASSLEDSIRIVQLTDLHNSIFGAQNSRLVNKVAAQKPDIILITGDLLNENEQRTDIAEELISQLTQFAPVYISYGNHERSYEKNYQTDLRAVYSEAGATVLEREWQDITVNDQLIRLGGIYGYCLPPEYEETGEAWPAETAFLKDFQDTEKYTILMCHLPYSWLVRGALDGWDVDCVLCGHVHGGQVRFPLIGGLWAPDQGWFPGRESGLYWSADGSKVMALSRGLGNTDSFPRFNNIPEVLVLDLLPGEKS